MKTFLKILSGIVLTVSCFYLSFSLFVYHFVEDDIVDTVVDSTLVEEAVTNVSQEALSSSGLNQEKASQIAAMIENDQQAKQALKQYTSTLLNDAINNENTFDENVILEQLKDKKDMVYELVQPDMTKEQFDQIYSDTVDSLDLQQVYQTTVNEVSTKMDEEKQTKDMLSLLYFFHEQFHIYIAIVLMVLSLAYLAVSSIKEKGMLNSGIMIIYLLCGILTLLMAFAIVLVLSAVIPSTMNLSISSIRYMYLSAGIYIALAIVGYIANVFLKRKNRYRKYAEF